MPQQAQGEKIQTQEEKKETMPVMQDEIVGLLILISRRERGVQTHTHFTAKAPSNLTPACKVQQVALRLL